MMMNFLENSEGNTKREPEVVTRRPSRTTILDLWFRSDQSMTIEHKTKKQSIHTIFLLNYSKLYQNMRERRWKDSIFNGR